MGLPKEIKITDQLLTFKHLSHHHLV